MNAASGAAPGALDDALLQLDQPQHRKRDRRLVHGDHAIDDALDDFERRGAELRDREAVRQRRRECHERGLAARQRSGEAGRRLGLDADDFDAGLLRLDDDADARR